MSFPQAARTLKGVADLFEPSKLVQQCCFRVNLLRSSSVRADIIRPGNQIYRYCLWHFSS